MPDPPLDRRLRARHRTGSGAGRAGGAADRAGLGEPARAGAGHDLDRRAQCEPRPALADGAPSRAGGRRPARAARRAPIPRRDGRRGRRARPARRADHARCTVRRISRSPSRSRSRSPAAPRHVGGGLGRHRVDLGDPDRGGHRPDLASGHHRRGDGRAAASFAIGAFVRTRGARMAALRADAERRQQSAEERERVRIARELHDVLGHALSQMNVQASVGLHLFDRDPEQARTALREREEHLEARPRGGARRARRAARRRGAAGAAGRARRAAAPHRRAHHARAGHRAGRPARRPRAEPGRAVRRVPDRAGGADERGAPRAGRARAHRAGAAGGSGSAARRHDRRRRPRLRRHGSRRLRARRRARHAGARGAARRPHRDRRAARAAGRGSWPCCRGGGRRDPGRAGGRPAARARGIPRAAGCGGRHRGRRRGIRRARAAGADPRDARRRRAHGHPDAGGRRAVGDRADRGGSGARRRARRDRDDVRAGRLRGEGRARGRRRLPREGHRARRSRACGARGRRGRGAALSGRHQAAARSVWRSGCARPRTPRCCRASPSASARCCAWSGWA